MEIEFWKQSWQENKIGFHRAEVNPLLTEFWPPLPLAAHAQVLVPLCGKSLDMAWLASQGYRVLGVECSEKAIRGFFSEQELAAETAEYHAFTIHQSANINLLEGDFFKLESHMLSDVSAVYDRASLVALPREMRQDYVELLVKRLPEAASILLVTLEYNQSLMSGPPFSVPDEEVRQLYSPYFAMEKLREEDIFSQQARYKEWGLDCLIERVYRLQRHG